MSQTKAELIDPKGDVAFDTNTFYVDATNNRVGVGSNAPSYLLDLLGSAPRIRVKDSSTGAAFHHFENNSGNFYLGIDNSTGGSLSAGNYARLLWSQGAYPLVFATNDTERMRIDSTGLVTLSGPGIKFPATQVASADANVLDDYEEGTWTPSAANLTINSGSVAYTARYIKTGRQVTVWLTATGANVTATNSTTFSGLPFVPQSDYGVGLLYDYGATGKKAVAQAYNDSKIYLNAISADLANMTALALTVSYTVS